MLRYHRTWWSTQSLLQKKVYNQRKAEGKAEAKLKEEKSYCIYIESLLNSMTKLPLVRISYDFLYRINLIPSCRMGSFLFPSPSPSESQCAIYSANDLLSIGLRRHRKWKKCKLTGSRYTLELLSSNNSQFTGLKKESCTTEEKN